MKTIREVFSEFINDPYDVLSKAVKGNNLSFGDEDYTDPYQLFLGWGIVTLVIFVLLIAWVLTQILRLGEPAQGANPQFYKIASRFVAAGVAFSVCPVLGYIPAIVFFFCAEIYLSGAKQSSHGDDHNFAAVLKYVMTRPTNLPMAQAMQFENPVDIPQPPPGFLRTKVDMSHF